MADMTLSDFRKQYPMYDDMTDTEVADKLYQSYPEMPREEFNKKLGYSPWRSRAWEVAAGVPQTVATGALNLPGTVYGAIPRLLGSEGPPHLPLVPGSAGQHLWRDVGQSAMKGLKAVDPQSAQQLSDFGEWAGREIKEHPTAVKAAGKLSDVAMAVPQLRAIGETAGGFAEAFAPRTSAAAGRALGLRRPAEAPRLKTPEEAEAQWHQPAQPGEVKARSPEEARWEAIGLQTGRDQYWARFLSGAHAPETLVNNANDVAQVIAQHEQGHRLPLGLARTEAALRPAQEVYDAALNGTADIDINGNRVWPELSAENAALRDRIGHVGQGDAIETALRQDVRDMEGRITGPTQQRLLSKLRKEGYERLGSDDVDQHQIGRAQLDLAAVLDGGEIEIGDQRYTLRGHIAENLKRWSRVTPQMIRDAREHFARVWFVEGVREGSDVNLRKITNAYKKNPARVSGPMADVARMAEEAENRAITLRRMREGGGTGMGTGSLPHTKVGALRTILGELPSWTGLPQRALQRGIKEEGYLHVAGPERARLLYPGRDLSHLQMPPMTRIEEGLEPGPGTLGAPLQRDLLAEAPPAEDPEAAARRSDLLNAPVSPHVAETRYQRPAPAAETPTQEAWRLHRERGGTPAYPVEPEPPRAVPYTTRGGRGTAAPQRALTPEQIREFHRQLGQGAEARARELPPSEPAGPTPTQRAMRARRARESAENEVRMLQQELQANPRNQETLTALREAERRLREMPSVSDMMSDLE